VPTARNAPCLRFLESSGLTRTSEHDFAWTGATEYPLPEFVTLTGALEFEPHLAAVAE
jgi:hypothetical protein